MKPPSRRLSQERAGCKALGAFYTAEPVARYLVEWALQKPTDSLLDPSFGGGVFLQAATARLQQLGGSAAQVHGVELDQAAYSRVAAELAGGANLHCADFLAITPSHLGQVDCLVGNPPYIRAARLSAAGRELALARAAAQGVRLSKRCSAWAPFVVHASAFVKPGGRMAMVVPAELGHAVYARAVLRHLTRSFAQVTLLSPRERLFPDLDQETLLLLAEGRGETGSGSSLSVGRWSPPLFPAQQLGGTVPIKPLLEGASRLVSALLPERVRALYQELAAHPRVRQLGALAEVGIGYVTGANRFFHLSPAEVAHWELPPEVLRPALWRSRALVGLRLLPQDWREACASGTAGYLLHLAGQPLSDAVVRYLAHGEASRVAQGYKALERRCWYQVNNVKVPDLLLAAMGLQPALAVNEAKVTAPNTLHMVRLHPYSQTTALALSLGWQTALTRLSLEVEGHALGGGLLKLEPSEARRVLVALPTDAGLEPALDQLLRQRRFSEALELADRVILQEGLGLTRQECCLLREGYHLLRARREHRRKSTE